MDQDPVLLCSGQVTTVGPSLVALSPDGRTVAVGTDTSVTFWDAANGQQDQTLENLHAGMSPSSHWDLIRIIFKIY